MRLDIKIQRQIIQYHTLNSSFSNRKIARMLGLSHTTVGRVITLFQKCDLRYDELAILPNKAFTEQLGSKLQKLAQLKKLNLIGIIFVVSLKNEI